MHCGVSLTPDGSMNQAVTATPPVGNPIIDSESSARRAGAVRAEPGRMSDRDSAFLIQATRLLAESLDIETTLATVARTLSGSSKQRKAI